MATYTLPTFTNQLGTYTVTISSTVTGLSTPTVNTILDLRGGREVMEIIPGGLSYNKPTITVRDTSDRFWDQLCGGTTFILVLLDEGSGNTFAFGGDIKRESSKAVEIYNDGTTKYRQLTVTLQSPLERLKDVDISLIDNTLESSSAQVKATSDNDWFCPISALFAFGIEYIFTQDYDATDAYWQAGTGTYDFLWNDEANDLTFDELYFQTQEEDAYIGYFDTTNDDYLPNNYATVWDFYQDLSKSFGVTMRYDYNPTTSRHRIQLLQKGRAFTGAVALGSPAKSGFNYESYMKVRYVQATLMISDVQKGYYYTPGVYTLAPVPDWFEPDIEINMFFVAGNNAPTYDTGLWQRLWSMATGDPSPINRVKFWDYSAATMTEYNSVNIGDARSEKAIIAYLVNRFRGTTQITYNRTYPQFKASGGSHTALQPMCGVTVDSETYTATEVDKDFSTGEAHLTLVKL